ncbi:hypothetical protein IGI04_038769 [Brassica rapa subsp. trilocularis]|uniref:Uncharacterized protein n=1 Tax=Brassica rapa subsp. trilocularis TaxID=1813537 RepID=A0ABQ7LPB5_BRACM|nr:hypothetical protein IGI04_038769 [Brassica rapa subsp. trilocularis]
MEKLRERRGLTFFKPHDCKAFDLPKFVWGTDGVSLDSAAKFTGKSKNSGKIVTSSPNGRNCEDKVVNTNEGEASSLVELDEFVTTNKFVVDDLSAQKGWSRLCLRE